MREVLGQRASIAMDRAQVHAVAASDAIVRADAAARAGRAAEAERLWGRVAEQLRKAQSALADAEVAALGRRDEARRGQGRP